MDRINILDIDFNNISMADAVKAIFTATQGQSQQRMSFINAHCLNVSMKDLDYRQILQQNDLVFPDGSGVNIACKILGKKVIENVNGTDMLPLLCQRAVKENKSLYLLGSETGIAAQMETKLRQQFNKLKIAGTHHGFFNFETESDKIIDSINTSKADIVLIGFGTPLQEKWIQQHGHKINSKVLIGVGGLFDFYSGQKPRAPLFLRKIGMEWCYRLYLEPLRLFSRYVIGNPLFIARILKWKFTRPKK